MILENCKIVSKKWLTENVFVLTIISEIISETALPGQFVNVSVNKFLRRPISIFNVDKDSKTFEIGIKILGEGTRYLSELEAGESLNILGPLGTPFKYDVVQNATLVGGGVGIFPLYFLAKELHAKNIPINIIFGFRSSSESFIREDCLKITPKVIYTSEAGDLDFSGTVVQAFESQLECISNVVYTCGPTSMMKRISEISLTENLTCYVSLEEHMACGTGICLVCACKTKNEDGSEQYLRCCKEGPCFNASDVIWN